MLWPLSWLFPKKRKRVVITHPIYVSMTTIPERLQSRYFRNVVATLLRQNFQTLVLNVPWVYKRTGEEYRVPEWVTKEPRIKVVRCEDMGPVTKVLGGLAEIPDDAWVIVVDDDQIYEPFLVDELTQAYAYDPNGVWCFAVFAENEWIRRGPHFRFAAEMPCGYAGWIASSKDLKKLLELPRFSQCSNIDDHWLGWAFYQIHVPVRPIDRKYAWNHSLQIKHPSRPGQHPKWFELHTQTNRRRLQRICGARLFELSETLSQSRSKQPATLSCENEVRVDQSSESP